MFAMEPLSSPAKGDYALRQGDTSLRLRSATRIQAGDGHGCAPYSLSHDRRMSRKRWNSESSSVYTLTSTELSRRACKGEMERKKEINVCAILIQMRIWRKSRLADS